MVGMFGTLSHTSDGHVSVQHLQRYLENARPGEHTQLVCMPVQDLEESRRMELRRLLMPESHAAQTGGTPLCSGGWPPLIVARTDLVNPKVRSSSG